jgi:hypothetical protein
MKLSLPYYLVAMFAGLVYSIINYYVPTLPLTNEQVVWVVLSILALLNVDVTQALRARGLLG